MRIVEVKQKIEIKNFLDLPARIYCDDPHYIEHIRSDIEAVFDPKQNKSFGNGTAIRWIALNENGECSGRIAAFYQDKKSKRFGRWGFFDAFERDTAEMLIKYAEDWLKENDCEQIQAPVNFGSRDSYWGLRINADSAPSYQENYHRKVYQQWIEDLGYEREIEQTTYEISHQDFNFERFSNISQRTLKNNDYRFVSLDYSRINQFASDFVEIYNQAWSFHDDFEHLVENELLARLKEMKAAVIPETIIFAYHQERPIGFFVNMLEINQVFKDFNGELTLWNKLRYLFRRGQIGRLKAVVFGVIPDYQNKGVEAGMIMKLYREALKLNNYKVMELSWIGDFNPKMLSMLKSLGARLIKIHHTYFKVFS
jgi:GNAT superfamily N-acetyltransferase